MAAAKFQSAQTEARIRAFAATHNMTLREAVECLCRLGLALRETPGGELPPSLVEELYREGLSPYPGNEDNRQLQLWPKDPCSQLYLWPGLVNDGGPGYAERRRFGRVPVRLPSEGRHSPDTAKWYEFHADIVNASMKGVRMLLPREAPINVGNTVKLAVPDMNVAAKGLVRNMKPDARGQNMWEVGVGFTDMSRVHWNNWMEMLTEAAVFC